MLILDYFGGVKTTKGLIYGPHTLLSWPIICIQILQKLVVFPTRLFQLLDVEGYLLFIN